MTRITDERLARRTKSAMAYVQVERRSKEIATWMDVAAAYDAGMRHALECARSARNQLEMAANNESTTILETE